MATTTCLLDLNEDCLSEIFSLKYISLMDLCSLAWTSNRLKEIAGIVFSRSYKVCFLPSLAKTMTEAKLILMTFGEKITEMWIGKLDDEFWKPFNNVEWMDILNLMPCCTVSLTSLKLHKIVIPQYILVKFMPIFKTLKKLHIDDCYMDGFCRDLFKNCESLIELDITGGNFEIIDCIFQNSFSKLQSFTYRNYKSDLDKFILRHKNLKAINIDCSQDCTSSFSIIADNCQKLQEFEMNCVVDETSDFAKALQGLLTLRHLTKLRINCNSQNVTRFSQQLNSLKFLRFLSLSNVGSDSEFISTISQLKKIQVLKLTFDETLPNFILLDQLNQLNQLKELTIASMVKIELDLVLLIQRLISLKTLTLYVENFEISQNTYLQIVDVVRARHGIPKSLEISFYTKDDLSSADYKCFKANRSIVKIIILQFSLRLLHKLVGLDLM